MKKLIIILIIGIVSIIGLLLSVEKNNPIVSYSLRGTDEVLYEYRGDEVVPEDDELPALRTKNSRTYEKNGKFVTRIYPSPQMIEKNSKWYYLEKATSTKEDFARLNKSTTFFLKKALADTFYASTSDGYIYNGSTDECEDGQPWGPCHDATSGDVAYGSTDTFYVGAGEIALVGDGWFFYRAFLPFDTSAIPSDSTIFSATLNLQATGTPIGSTGTTTDYIRVVQTSQADSSSITTADFDQCGDVTDPVAGANDIDINDISTTTTNVFTLNSTGRSWIKKSGQASNCGTIDGYTCIGLREGHDVQNESENQPYTVQFVSSNKAGTLYDPYLEVTFGSPNYELIFFD